MIHARFVPEPAPRRFQVTGIHQITAETILASLTVGSPISGLRPAITR